MQKLTSNIDFKREVTTRFCTCLSNKPNPADRPAPPVGVSIEYCVPGNYERIATVLADSIHTELGESVRLFPSRDGVFEVSVHGRVVFSKRACSRFPEREEIFYHLRNR
tara:strand:+ start:226 stop:552 length:327 start_codon:yes stop_codon:yes gene_type:complete